MKKYISSLLTLTLLATISSVNISYAAHRAAAVKATPDKLLEAIRENATIIMDQKLIKNHASAHTAITTAINSLKKENKELAEKLQHCISIISSKEKIAKEKHAAYTELMGVIATTVSVMTTEQIDLVNEQTTQVAEKEKQSTDQLAAIDKALAQGKITAEQAAEQVAAINAELAQDQQALLKNSSYLSQLSATLASPFQWIGNKLFDEQTSNLKRAAYIVGATAGAVAIGAAAYYGITHLMSPSTAPENTTSIIENIKQFGSEALNTAKEKAQTMGTQVTEAGTQIATQATEAFNTAKEKAQTMGTQATEAIATRATEAFNEAKAGTINVINKIQPSDEFVEKTQGAIEQFGSSEETPEGTLPKDLRSTESFLTQNTLRERAAEAFGPAKNKAVGAINTMQPSEAFVEKTQGAIQQFGGSDETPEGI